jgi:hypothetical protein
MGKQGPLPRGRRPRDEVPAIPDVDDLTQLEARAQRALRALVESAGGRFESKVAIPIGYVEDLVALLDAWGHAYARQTNAGLYFTGQPGLWQALDRLYPLQDPNRWDKLRAVLIAELEARGWRRKAPPRGMSFYIDA